MPDATEILRQLATIAIGWQPLAVLWHAYFGALAIGLLAGFKPSGRATGVLLAVPLFSVSLMAWAVGNPFKGSVFALAAGGLSALALTFPSTAVHIAPIWATTIGVGTAAFGWVYPHFLRDAETFLAYLYAAPTGLIPCPTLSVAVGFSLMLRGLGSRAWSVSLALLGITYGLIGGAILGVAIDWLLLLGSSALLFAALPRAGIMAPGRPRSA